MENDTQRTYCYGNNSARLEIFERPSHESALFIRHCVCNSSTDNILPISYVSSGRDLEVHFTAINMTKYDDPDSLNFMATFEFLKLLPPPEACKDPKRKLGSEGAISLNEGDVSLRLSSPNHQVNNAPFLIQIECKSRPWLIEPTTGKFLYVSFRGYYLSRYNPQVPLPINQSVTFEGQPICPTKSRLIITSGDSEFE